MAEFDSMDWLVAAAVVLLIAVAGYMYWDLALGDDPIELPPPELSATAGP